VQGKNTPQQTTHSILSPIERMPFYLLNISPIPQFKTAEGKAGLQAAIKNGQSLSKKEQNTFSAPHK